MGFEQDRLVGDRAGAGARAVAVGTEEVYRATVSPGWASWVTVWPADSGELFLSFQELRRGKNPLWEPVPPAFWEAMGLPHGYHETLCNGSRDLINEIVVLKSEDSGTSWVEISRQPTHLTQTFSWVALPGNRLLRSLCNDYVAWHPGDQQITWSEVSRDGGNTWERQAVIAECHSGSPHRLRRLRDGTLVQLLSATTPFGPGRKRFSRHTRRPFVRQELISSLYFSRDEGKTWSGPCPVLPGILAWEPDFVELPSGELLVLNSAVQAGPQVRQHLRQGPWGWIPGPVYDIVSGRVPECLVHTQSGLIVGAVRGGDYTVSNDEGASWHKIEGLPACGYQPSITELPDGRLLCAWHGGGGDEAFGKKDLYIGAHIFRLEAWLPQRTELSLARDLDADGRRYINRYTVTLTGAGAPIPGKSIRYRVKKREGYYRNSPGELEGAVVTDARGQASIELMAAFGGEPSIHLSYELTAWFEPDGGDRTLSPAKAGNYLAYAITTTKEELGW